MDKAEGCGDGREVRGDGINLVREGGGVLVEGVENFKYLGRPLYQIDNDYPVVQWNVNWA